MGDMDVDVREVNLVREIREVRTIERRRKVYPQRINIMHKYEDNSFKMKYRLSKISARNLMELLRPSLRENANQRGLPISVETRVLLSLRFFARGGFQDDLADLHNVSQATASRIVSQVARGICMLARQIISFPVGEGRLKTVRQFHEIAAFPQVIIKINYVHKLCIYIIHELYLLIYYFFF